MTATDRSVLDLIELIYGAVGRPEAWDPLAIAIGESFWCGMSVIGFVSRNSNYQVLGGCPRTRPYLAEIAEEYYKYDFVSTPFYSRPPGDVVFTSDIMTDEEIEATRYYRELMVRYGVFHMMGAHYRTFLGATMLPSAMRAREGGAFTEDERRTASLIFRHVHRAVELHTTLEASRERAGALGQLVNSLAAGVVLVDEEGRPVETNSRGQEILARADGLFVEGGKLTVASPGQAGELRRLIAGCADTTRGNGQAAGGHLRVACGSQGGFYTISVAPLRGLNIGSKRIVSAVMVNDPGWAASLDPGHVGKLLDLTMAEAKVAAAFCRHVDIKEAAESIDYTSDSFRTTLKRVYAKTGAKGQADLMRLVLGCLAVASDHG